MSHWILDSIGERRAVALKIADSIQVYQYLLSESDIKLVRDIAFALELATLDLILERSEEDEAKLKTMQECASDAFRLLCVLPPSKNPIKDAMILLRMSALNVIGDKETDAARLLRQREWNNLPLESDNWGERTWATILDIWLRLFHKKGWDDMNIILERVAHLRGSQNQFEKQYLESIKPWQAKAAALDLIGLYHLAKAAEIFTIFIKNGAIEGNYQVRQMVETHFNHIFTMCEHAQMFELEPLTHLLAVSSIQMIEKMYADAVRKD